MGAVLVLELTCDHVEVGYWLIATTQVNPHVPASGCDRITRYEAVSDSSPIPDVVVVMVEWCPVARGW